MPTFVVSQAIWTSSWANGDGALNYIENIGTSTAPVFVVRTRTRSTTSRLCPFDGIDVGSTACFCVSQPLRSEISTTTARSDRVRGRFQHGCDSRFASNAGCSDLDLAWAMRMASSTTSRTPGRLRRRRSFSRAALVPPRAQLQHAQDGFPCVSTYDYDIDDAQQRKMEVRDGDAFRHLHFLFATTATSLSSSSASDASCSRACSFVYPGDTQITDLEAFLSSDMLSTLTTASRTWANLRRVRVYASGAPPRTCPSRRHARVPL